MCLGGPKVSSTPLPPTPPATPTMADPAVQQARFDTQRQAAQAGGLSSTRFNRKYINYNFRIIFYIWCIRFNDHRVK